MQFIVNRLFSDINVLQGSVTTYARCGGIFDSHVAAHLRSNLPVKKSENWLRFNRIITMSFDLTFWPTLYTNEIGNWTLSARTVYYSAPVLSL